MRRADAPTGIFCYNDGYAEAVARAVLEAGFRIPHDVSLVGFGNETETHGEVPLTTFDQHPVEIGKAAARLYLDRVESTNGDADGTIQRKLIPADLVVRASTAAPR